MAVSRKAESPKFPRFIGNRGRGTLYDSALVLYFISYNLYTSDPDKLYALSRRGVSFPRQGVKCHRLPPVGAKLVTHTVYLWLVGKCVGDYSYYAN